MLFDEVLIPPAVWREVVIVGSGRIGAQAVREAEWIRLERLPDQAILPALSSLDPGEAEALTLASFHGPHVALLLDDLRARSIAQDLGLTVTGSAGILLRAKEAGVIQLVKPILDELLTAGLFISAAAITRLMDVADEL